MLLSLISLLSQLSYSLSLSSQLLSLSSGRHCRVEHHHQHHSTKEPPPITHQNLKPKHHKPIKSESQTPSKTQTLFPLVKQWLPPKNPQQKMKKPLLAFATSGFNLTAAVSVNMLTTVESTRSSAERSDLTQDTQPPHIIPETSRRADDSSQSRNASFCVSRLVSREFERTRLGAKCGWRR